MKYKILSLAPGDVENDRSNRFDNDDNEILYHMNSSNVQYFVVTLNYLE